MRGKYGTSTKLWRPVSVSNSQMSSDFFSVANKEATIAPPEVPPSKFQPNPSFSTAWTAPICARAFTPPPSKTASIFIAAFGPMSDSADISLDKSNRFSCFIATKTRDLLSSKKRVFDIFQVLKKFNFEVLYQDKQY